MKLFPALFVLAGTLLATSAMAQSQPRDVRIDISSGQGKRIHLFCQSLDAAGDRDSREGAVAAEEVLANDLDNSGVFAVARAWHSGDPAGNLEADEWLSHGFLPGRNGSLSF